MKTRDKGHKFLTYSIHYRGMRLRKKNSQGYPSPTSSKVSPMASVHEIKRKNIACANLSCAEGRPYIRKVIPHAICPTRLYSQRIKLSICFRLYQSIYLHNILNLKKDFKDAMFQLLLVSFGSMLNIPF